MPSKDKTVKLVVEQQRQLCATKRATRRCAKCGAWYPWFLTETEACMNDGWYPGAPVIKAGGRV